MVKTLSDPVLWKKVNILGGIVFTIIGLIFSYIFCKILKIIDKEKKTKEFVKNPTLYTIIVVICCLVSPWFTNIF